MSVSINGTSGLVFNDASTQNTAATGFGFKNRIINGAMMIDQRNAGASVTPTDGQFTLDRWKTFASQTGKMSIQQNAGAITPPAGYSKYLGVTSLSAYSVTSSDYFAIVQPVEGQNVVDMAWGTSSASAVTLSFWVRSSLTGTFGGAFRNGSGTRSYPFTYTISAANTWEQKSITIAGDTGGTWVTTNAAGALVEFGLGVGSIYSGTAGAWAGAGYESATGATSVVGTNGATFYITGVQLEKGSTATSFDYRPYSTELALCQRYAYVMRSSSASVFTRFGMGINGSTTNGYPLVFFPTTMRSSPTISTSAFADFALWNGVTLTTPTNFLIDQATPNNISINVIVASGLTTSGPIGLLSNNSSTAIIQFLAEL